MNHADRVLKAIKKEKESITEIARFLSLHPSTVGKCIEQLKAQYPITERQEGHKKYFRLPRQSLPLSTGPGDPWGHLRTWGKDQ
jgi:DNA-binding IclR family transcriptional regulator